jgi:pyrimidine operon attenuation protein/uracil phosphoribosyltransferase
MSVADEECLLLDAAAVASATEVLIEGIAAQVARGEELFLAGIPTRGVVLAGRVARGLQARGIGVGLGTVDTSMHRDDLGTRSGVAALRGTELPLDLDRWSVVLVDDVQHTGRTARAAIEAVLAFGRPRRILHAVLVDRGGRELPVRPDATGVVVSVPPRARVRVRLMETDGQEGVYEL